ncbi:hypothetical protein R3P38DRAFT_2791913 [Favolaschia claudopus]|uniref:Uncharacterized protein n=1 Tax=Favolaschia claudopus TaxID=2862362 RepID=A0AAW0AF89_9AGAR
MEPFEEGYKIVSSAVESQSTDVKVGDNSTTQTLRFGKETADQAIQQGNAQVNKGIQQDIGELAAHSSPLERNQPRLPTTVSAVLIYFSRRHGKWTLGAVGVVSPSACTIAATPDQRPCGTQPECSSHQSTQTETSRSPLDSIDPQKPPIPSTSAQIVSRTLARRQAVTDEREAITTGNCVSKEDTNCWNPLADPESLAILPGNPSTDSVEKSPKVMGIHCKAVKRPSQTAGIHCKVGKTRLKLLESTAKLTFALAIFPGNSVLNSVNRGLKTVEFSATTPSVGRNSVRINSDCENLPQISGQQEFSASSLSPPTAGKCKQNLIDDSKPL